MYPVNTTHLYNIYTMLDQRRRLYYYYINFSYTHSAKLGKINKKDDNFIINLHVVKSAVNVIIL